MKPAVKQSLFWTPRILGLLLGLFVALFAFDVFGEARGPWDTALAFAIHLIPGAIVLGAVAVAWRWELAGGAMFLALAVAYVVMTGGRQPWSAYALLSGLPALLGVLFLVNWFYRAHRGAHART